MIGILWAEPPRLKGYYEPRSGVATFIASTKPRWAIEKLRAAFEARERNAREACNSEWGSWWDFNG